MKIHFEEPPIAIEHGDVSLCSVTKRSSLVPPDLLDTSIRDDESTVSDKSFDHQASMSRQNSAVEEEEETDAVAAGSDLDISAKDQASFLSLRITYLIVTLVVMLADGLQGTHLYVLYEGYGFTVANLYCLGFVTGALASPITGPLVDKLGRKKSALLYCILEISINRLEQYPILAGLIISRMVGGVTTNLLSTVFDAWLDTEYRRRGIRKDGGYEIIMRDSVIVSNLAAIGSGYLAHILAEVYGPKGPFEGAVACTSIALIVIMFIWTENYGCGDDEIKGMKQFMNDAVTAFKSDSKVLRLGIIQGLTCGSIQIFIFLWTPALRHFAVSAPKGSIGLDTNGEPAYGLIFGAFMAAGVLGGLTAPWIRKCADSIMMKLAAANTASAAVPSQFGKDGQQTNDDRTMAVEALSTFCYITSAFLLLLPCLLDGEGKHSFTICLGAFLVYEYVVGLYLPCEGVLRSIYFPAEGRASILTLPRIIVNCAVSGGVVLTNYMTMRSAFSSIFILMIMASGLQLSFIFGNDEVSWTGVLTSAINNDQPETSASIVVKIASSRGPSWWDCTPELNRASFCSQLDSSDESSLSSNDEIPDAKARQEKLKSE